MYYCTNHHTGSAAARDTKDRAARPHLPSSVENQLGRRRRQLLTIGQWTLRTLIDREAADRPERRTALVATELAKYNIDIAALCETRFKINTAKLSTISHRESFEQEMESALAQWEEKESSTPDEEWAALQQVVYNTAKTYLCKPERKHQDWVDPNDQELDSYEQKKPSPPESVANQEH